MSWWEIVPSYFQKNSTPAKVNRNETWRNLRSWKSSHVFFEGFSVFYPLSCLVMSSHATSRKVLLSIPHAFHRFIGIFLHELPMTYNAHLRWSAKRNDSSLRRLLKSIPLPQLRDPRNSCFATLSSARSCVVMPRSNSSDKTRKTWESRISQKGSTFYIGLSPCPFYMRGSLFLTLISTVTGRTNPNFIYLNHNHCNC